MVVVIDPQIAGISGDMLLCSLVDLGADKDKIISGIKQSAKFLPGSIIKKIEFERIIKHGIESYRLVLELDESVDTRKGTEIKDAVVRSAGEIGLSKKAILFAESCIDTLISSESRIHGTAYDSVHFHEASSIDTLVDVIGVAIALDDLGLFDERIFCLPVSVGGGSVTFSHGTMSNPASAILEIFRDTGLVIRGNNSGEELTTPTGACILVNLAHESVEYYPPLRVTSVGYGAGQKDFDDFSNVLKMVRGIKSNFDTDSVKILETNVDDVSGEVLGNLVEKIMGQGARDVSIYPGITKKGRPTSLVSVICDDSDVESIADTLVMETGTLGIRISESTRLVVPRSVHTVTLSISNTTFQVRYKRSLFKGRTSFKIEFDDLKRVSDTVNKPLRETKAILRKEIETLEFKDDNH